MFAQREPVDFHFRLFSAEGIAKPRNHGKYRNRGGHSEISYHLAVIGESVGYYAVQHAEHNDEYLTYRVAFRREDERSRADQRCGEGEPVFTVENAEGYAD